MIITLVELHPILVIVGHYDFTGTLAFNLSKFRLGWQIFRSDIDNTPCCFRESLGILGRYLLFLLRRSRITYTFTASRSFLQSLRHLFRRRWLRNDLGLDLFFIVDLVEVLSGLIGGG